MTIDCRVLGGRSVQILFRIGQGKTKALRLFQYGSKKMGFSWVREVWPGLIRWGRKMTQKSAGLH